MLVLPQADPCVRIMGIDPGTDRLGCAILEVNLETARVRVKIAQTFKSTNAPTRYPVVSEVHGNRVAKHHFLRDEISYVLATELPGVVASESPFMGKLAQAFEALIQVVYIVRLALFDHDTQLPLLLIDPPTVKKGVGAKGNADKDVMKEAVCNLPLEWAEGIVPEELDEHSIDAIAVAWNRVASIFAVCKVGQP